MGCYHCRFEDRKAIVKYKAVKGSCYVLKRLQDLTGVSTVACTVVIALHLVKEE